MTLDDLKRLLTSKTLYRLDTLLSVRLVPVLYAVGLAALLVWAIGRLFATFGSGFGHGLWGLLEIAVFGLLGLVALRIVCEGLLIFFKANEGATETVNRTRVSASLLDELRDAIRDLSEADDDGFDEFPEDDITPATEPLPSVEPAPVSAADLPVRGPTVKRTARRSPRKKAE